MLNTANVETSALCSIRIDNQEIKYNISSIQLDQFIDDHHTLQVRIRQVGKASSAKDFDDPGTYTAFLGKSLSLNIKPTGGLVDASKELEFIGIVTQVSLDNSIDGINTVLITAKSPTISMDGARRNAFYYDQTASDIIGSILSKHPITLGTVESTKRTFKIVVQYRESDYDFIMRMAGENGKFAFFDGKEFRLVKASGADTEELVWRETLGSFSLGLGTVPYEFTSKVYNYEQSKDYTQDTKALPPQSALAAMSKTAPDASANIFRDSGFSSVPRLLEDAQSLDEILLAKKNQSLGNMIQCLGHSIIPKVAVGHCVKIKGMDKIDGTFWVKSVQHILNESGKYHNSFSCTPLDMAFPSLKTTLRPFAELQSAEVVDNQDPEKLGRIKVKFKWDDSDTLWIQFVTLHAGDARGWYCLPEIGDEVLVGYEQGNPDFPIALGALTNKNSPPHGDTNNSKNDVKMFITRGGNQIYFYDEAGKEQIKIATKGGDNTIILDMDGPKLSIESKGDISIKANNVAIESQQKLELKAGTDLDVSGVNVKLKANANADIQGTMVNVKGTPINLN
jgi:type VI secretion system secreted protein VgrG